MKANRRRNLIVLIAIVLTTVMFTSLFSALLSVMKSTQQQEIRMSMNSSHITADNLTREKFDQAAKSDEIESFGRSIYMTNLTNKELVKALTELCYADKKGAQAVLSSPDQGRMPEKYNEIAMSTLTLDFLGIPKKVGSKVELEYTLSGEQQVQTFVLSGYWKGDPLFSKQKAWVSEAFCQKNTAKATAQSIERGNREGAYTLYIWCKDIFHLSDTVEKMEAKYHFASTYGSIYYNSAYDLFAEDSFPFDTVLVMLVVIFTAGYLIIYNVFRISVNSDIRTYGLLKNIGTTGRQLKSIVRRQAMTLSIVGVPLGLLIGYVIGLGMTPYLLSGDSSMGIIEVDSSNNPLIFIVAALFSILTIYIGCQMPARIVAKISPVEAVRLNLEDGSSKRSAKKTGRITPFTMAVNSMKRSWKKAVLVILSLALPMVLLNASYSLTQSFDYDQFLSIYSSFDFDVSGITNNLNTSHMSAVTPEFVEEVLNQEDTEEVALIYNTDVSYVLDDKGYANLKSIIDQAEKEEYIKGYQLEQERKYLESGKAFCHVMGLNQAAYEKMQFLGKAPSYEEFTTGDYVIVSDMVQGFGTYYDPGDEITLQLAGGKAKKYTVLEIGWMPYDLTYRFGIKETIFDFSLYMPAAEYEALGGSENAMLIGIDVKEGTEKTYDKWLAGYIDQSQQSLYVESKIAIMEQCKGFAQKYYVILALLSGVLFLIGLLNFFNTSAVTMLARRRELALLEAVGQTRRQIRQMLITEGMVYLAAAVLLADTVGMAIASPMILNTVGRAFFFDYHMSVLPSILSLPLMVLIAIAVPVYNYKKMSRETIVERFKDE